MEDQIKTLLEHPEQFEDPVAKLGSLCGAHEVAQKGTEDEVPMFPTEDNFKALETLLGVPSGSDRFNDHEEDVMVFVESYKSGIYQAIEGKKKVQQACEDLLTGPPFFGK